MNAGSKEAEDLAVYFPKEFKPRSNDVIVGRGKKCYYHAGNQKLRRIVASRLEEYSGALSQKSKTKIISSIIEELRGSSTNVAFVKQHPKSKRWFNIGEALAREKVSQTFRDALNGNCKYTCRKRRQKAQEFSPKRARSKVTYSRVSLDFTETEHNPNSAHLNLLDSSVGLTESSNFVNSLISVLPPHLTKYENPFEPTPIFEAPSLILEEPLISSVDNTIVPIGENGQCNSVTPLGLQERIERDFLLLEKLSASTGGGQPYNISPTAETRVAQTA